MLSNNLLEYDVSTPPKDQNSSFLKRHTEMPKSNIRMIIVEITGVSGAEIPCMRSLDTKDRVHGVYAPILEMSKAFTRKRLIAAGPATGPGWLKKVPRQIQRKWMNIYHRIIGPRPRRNETGENGLIPKFRIKYTTQPGIKASDTA